MRPGEGDLHFVIARHLPFSSLRGEAEAISKVLLGIETAMPDGDERGR